MDHDAEIEEIEIRLFLEAVHARYGYDLREYAAASMRRRVLAALARSGQPSLGALQHAILHDPHLFAGVLEDLTVRVTEMFRDPPFYRVFRERVVPLLRTYPSLKIWHAGCSTGEEVYACAIVLAEEGLYGRAQIYATDLSPQALQSAKQGVYPAELLRTAEENYAATGGRATLTDYCTVAYDRVAFRESLRANVLFFQHNLVSDQVFAEVHVVFCRNVLIYFGAGLRDRVVDKLAQSLCPGGFLCLGSSERLLRSDGGPAQRLVPFAADWRIYRHAS